MSNALSEELLLCLCICVDVHLSVNDEHRDLCKGNNFYGKRADIAIIVISCALELLHIA